MIPADDATVEAVAKAIARSRIQRDANQELDRIAGVSIHDHSRMEEYFDPIFEMIWSRDNPEYNRRKADYREDARVAISSLNLKLLITPT